MTTYLSNEFYMNCSELKCSVLGPVWFIMYINSLCNMKINGSIITYADDTCLLFTDVTWDLVYNKAETELNRFIQNLNFKKITVNYEKTVFVAFSIYNCAQFSNQELIIYNHNHKTDSPNYFKIKRVPDKSQILRFNIRLQFEMELPCTKY